MFISVGVAETSSERGVKTQNSCITFIQCSTNVEAVVPAFYKCNTNVLYLLGDTNS